MIDPATPAKPTHPQHSAFAAPLRECDVVMKGGIAGGTGCPQQVLELARAYRFRSIAAASAGAIAAALTAAAEHGRERGGFEKLEALNEWLADERHRLHLLQPTRAARPLLALWLGLERRGRRQPAGPGAAGIVARAWSLLPAWVRLLFDVVPGALRDALPLRFWIATVLGCVAGGTLDVVLANGLVDASHPFARTVVAIVLPVMFIGSYLASVGACAWRLWHLASVVVPRQGFGICTGLTPASPATAPALTDWLHHALQDLSGLPGSGPPLTVGSLRATRVPGSGADAGIELRMVTTSPSLGKSCVLPTGDERFMFREDDMRRLFPAPVVDHLLATSPRADRGRSAPAGYHVLPEADDMPVLVLARMSMGFPILLSAVPLYVLGPGTNGDRENEPAPAAAPGPAADGTQRVWFGNSGLTGDDPVHALAAGLPTWRAEPAIRNVGSLPEFLAAIWTARLDFREQVLEGIPGGLELEMGTKGLLDVTPRDQPSGVA